ncbi:zerumbone synthase-like isoform X2 [Camellia sinensis]|uniref:zerumbone synthase-like isoform X1 n=1 Tax=Camellia sinensis TaxID=4442 RepID=UPI00103620F9|nr:zerumbone synthase-like isoform X1 [Camellia sinensis]XP_028098428.1 zerumbone synthase-like isoform X2 [Camellia sinensis]
MLIRLLTRELKLIFNDFSPKAARYSSATTAAAAAAAGGRLEGKVALITGGASGLGRATASEFLQHGARVVIADIDSQLGRQVAKWLGPEAHFIECDVGVESQVAEAVDMTVARHGRLDIMYNNAGITGPVFPPGIADLDLDEFDRVMRINVRGMIAGIKHAARVMIPALSGSILCTASISGLMGGLGPHPYTISKFTIPGIVKSVATELCKHGVRINCISPCPIPTPMVVSQFSGFFPDATQDRIMEIVHELGELKGSMCEEVDVAKAALYLASNEAKYITGHNLVVDGGFTCFKNLQFPSS